MNFALAALTADFHPFPSDFQWHLQVMCLKQDFIQYIVDAAPP